MRIKRKCARAGLPTSAVRRNASRKRRLLFMVRPFLGCGRGRIDASSCCTSGQQKSKATGSSLISLRVNNCARPPRGGETGGGGDSRLRGLGCLRQSASKGNG